MKDVWQRQGLPCLCFLSDGEPSVLFPRGGEVCGGPILLLPACAGGPFMKQICGLTFVGSVSACRRETLWFMVARCEVLFMNTHMG